MIAPLHVVGSLALQDAFERHSELVAAAKDTHAPQTPAEAAKWINASPTKEVRNARKILAHAAMYGAGPSTFLKSLGKLAK